MRKSLLVGLSLSMFAIAASAQAEPQTVAKELPVIGLVPPGTNKMMAILNTSPNCKHCAGIEQMLVAKGVHQSKFDFVKDSSKSLPGPFLQLAFAGHTVDIIYRSYSNKFQPTAADLDAIVADVNKLAELFDQRAQIEKPFWEQMDALNQLSISAVLFREHQEKEAEADYNKTIRPAADEFSALNDPMQAKTHPLAEQMTALRKERDLALKPISAKLSRLSDSWTDPTLFILNRQYTNAEIAGDSARMADLTRQTDERSNAITAEFNQLKAEKARVAAEYNAKIDALDRQIDELWRPVGDKLLDAQKKLEVAQSTASQAFQKRDDEFRSKELLITMPLEAAKTQLFNAKQAAVKDLAPQISAALDALDSVILSENPNQPKN